MINTFFHVLPHEFGFYTRAGVAGDLFAKTVFSALFFLLDTFSKMIDLLIGLNNVTRGVTSACALTHTCMHANTGKSFQ